MAPSTLAALAEKRTLVEKSVCDEDEHPTVAYNQFSNPVISLARIDEFDGTRGEICRKIVEACEEWGIFQVVDHGVDRKMIGEMYRLAREFFILPAEKQLRYDMTGGKKGGFLVSSHLQYLSNGRFSSADHQAVVNSNYSRLSITTFQHPAPEAIVCPLQIQEGEKPVLDEPITFTEMYRRKMNRDIELARLKKMAKDQQSDDLDQAELEYKPIEKLLA